MDPIDALAVLRLVPELFQITKALEAAAPGRHFTPDGHLVGSIGEAVAAARYGLELTTASTKGVDAHHKASGRSVEIKATVEGKRISLRGMEPEADHMQDAIAVICSGQSASGFAVSVAIPPTRTTCFGSFMVQLPA